MISPDRLVRILTGLKLPDDLAASHVEAGLFQLRPNVFLELRVERSLWQARLQRAKYRPED